MIAELISAERGDLQYEFAEITEDEATRSWSGSAERSPAPAATSTASSNERCLRACHRRRRSGCNLSMCDLEDIAEGIAHHRSTVSVWSVERLFQGRSPGCDCSCAGAVGIIDVYIEKRREELALTGLRHHDERVADPHLCWPSGMHVTSSSEHTPEKVDRACNVGNHEAWRHRVVARWRLDSGHD
jgi:hypothetical protein